MLSISPRHGTLQEAPASTVLLPDFSPNFIASFPMLDRNVKHCVSDMGRRFELFVDNGSPREVARLLRLVGVDCGSFSDRMVTALCLGTVLSNDIIPSVDRLEEIISIFSFLRFREGSYNTPRLPAGGWPEAVEAPRFVAAI